MAKKKKVAPKKKAAKKVVKPTKDKAAPKKVAVKKETVPPTENSDSSPKTKKERSSYLKRDGTKYELNGDGILIGKGKLAHKVLLTYLSSHQKTTFEQLGEVFPPSLHKGFSGIFQKVSEVKKKELTKRYFTQPDQILKTGDGISICCTNQFGAGNIGAIIEVAKKLGYKVKEHKAS